MSNKRIKKKRAKAEMLRDKSKLIANMLVLSEPGKTRYEYLRMAKPLLRLDMDTLMEISLRAVAQHWRRTFPLLRILPRQVDTREVVNWRPVIERWNSV